MRGFFNINKPAGMTSSDVVVKVRGILRKHTGIRYKVGHLGTLDPLATGVLPVTVGTATKLFDYFSGRAKSYTATFEFGYSTDTLDRDGTITQNNGRIPTLKEVMSAADVLIGDTLQIPPQYSAKSVGGKRAYEYARSGKSIDLPPKTVKIYDIAVRQGGKTGEYYLDIYCGSGTYIRAIGRDIATALGTYATMTTLIRTSAVGNAFNIHNANTLDEVQNNPLEYLIPLETVLSNDKYFELPEDAADKVLNGIKLKFIMPDGDFIVKLHENIIAIGEADAEGKLHLKTRL